MRAREFGHELRRLRTERGLSLAELASAVHYSKSHLSKVENGAKTAGPGLARRCDAALGAEGRLAGLAARTPTGASPHGDPPTAGDVEELVMNLRLAGPSRIGVVRRRDAHSGGGPCVAVWTLPAAESPDQIAPEVLASFRMMLGQMRRLGQHTSPSVLAPVVLAQTHALRSVAARAGAQQADEAVALAAHFALYAGWLAQESGDDRAARLWTGQAADLARAAGDTDLVAYTDVRRALGCLIRHDAANTVALAQHAAATASTRRVRGLAAQRQAQGHAIAGEYAACRAALDQATVLLDPASADDERSHGTDPVIGTSHVPDPAAAAEGWCLHDLGHSRLAAEILARELPRIPATAVRARARYGARLALALAAQREIEQACAVVAPVLADLPAIDSATVRVDLRRLAQTVSRWHGHPSVQALQPALTEALRQRAPMTGE